MSKHGKFCPSFEVLILILLWIHACSSDDSKFSDDMKKRKALKDTILNGYDKTIRPTEKNSNTTVVYTDFIPRQILNVDEEKGLFEMDSYLFLAWYDARLTWDTTQYDIYLQLPPEILWLPEVSVFNSHTAPVDPTQNVILLTIRNGSVWWFPPIRTSTSCPSLLEVAYPDDVVTCRIRMGSWAHTGYEVALEHAEGLWLDQFVNIHPRWELLTSQVKAVRNTTFYQGNNETFLFMDFVFPLRRRPPPEMEVIRSPCILLTILILAMFWMPPDSSNKLMMSGISFFALIVLLIYVACSTKFPLRVVIAVSSLQSTMYIVVVSILLQVLVIFNLCNMSGPARPPAVIMQLLSGPLGKYACLRSSPSSENVPIDRMQLKEDSQNFIKQQIPNEDWILFASGLDRLFFVLMSISTIAIHQV